MAKWRIGRTPAGETQDGPALANGERALVSATAGDGRRVVGTDRALHLGDGRVLGWHQVDHARWDVTADVLEIVTLPEGTTPPQTYRISIPDPGRLPELVRERVTSSILVTERIKLTGAAGARIVARRLPGDAGVRWSVIYDDGVSGADPQVQAVTRAAVERLKTRWGV